jgi:hypothetical protein
MLGNTEIILVNNYFENITHYGTGMPTILVVADKLTIKNLTFKNSILGNGVHIMT